MAKTKQDKEIEAKQKARESAKVRKDKPVADERIYYNICLLYTSPSPRDGLLSRMPSSA